MRVVYVLPNLIKKRTPISAAYFVPRRSLLKLTVVLSNTHELSTAGQMALEELKKTKEEVSIIFSYGQKANFNTTQRVVLNSRDA